LTSLLGVGGGVVVLPALIYLIGQHTTKAAGTSLLIVWVSSLIAGTGHIIQANFNSTLFIYMLIGGVVGTGLGTNLGLKLKGSKIRFYFVYVVIFAVAMVAVKLYTMTFGFASNQTAH
jgi:uncharacterized protein